MPWIMIRNNNVPEECRVYAAAGGHREPGRLRFHIWRMGVRARSKVRTKATWQVDVFPPLPARWAGEKKCIRWGFRGWVLGGEVLFSPGNWKEEPDKGPGKTTWIAAHGTHPTQSQLSEPVTGVRKLWFKILFLQNWESWNLRA